MAYVEGRDLHELMQEAGRMPVDRAVHFTSQLCQALEAAHAEGVVHRDLKPRNVLVDKDDQVYVSDFGLAKSLEAEASTMTRAGEVLGTPRYMSPEQAESKPADARSDIYSLGCSLYYLLTGKVVYDGDTMMKKLMAHQHAPIPSLADESNRVGRGTRPTNESSSTTDGGSRGLDPPYDSHHARTEIVTRSLRLRYHGIHVPR
jgi:serine/threonine protein kinase